MTRAGLGFDAHEFDPIRPLILGGLVVPGSSGLAGHSDADVVSHAVADALLGAARLGDLGSAFPADERWRDASSLDILAEVALILGRNGWSISSIDATIVAQAPRLGHLAGEMAGNIAGALGVAAEEVSIKATTTDGMGFTGRGEGIAAIAVVLVVPA